MRASKPACAAAAVLLLALMAPQLAAAVDWFHPNTPYLTPESPEAGGKFGRSVAIVGENVFVGAPGERTFAHFRCPGSDCVRVNEVRNSSSPEFGTALVAVGETLLVSSYDNNEVQVFRCQAGLSCEWVDVFLTHEPVKGQLSMTPESGGYSLAVIGHPTSPLEGEGSVGVYYKYSAFDRFAVLTSDASEPSFGLSVAITQDGNNLVFIGAPGTVGRVYYTRCNPVSASCDALATLPDTGVDSGDFFGLAIANAPTSSLVAVGAPLRMGGGAVHLFDCSTSCSLVAILTAPTAASMFGLSLAQGAGGLIAIGSADSVYLYDCSTPTACERLQRLDDESVGMSGGFGSAIALSGSRLVIGVPDHGDQGNALVYTQHTCDAACAACRGPGPEECVPCPQIERQGVCLDECPTGEYEEASACFACHDDCLTCSGGLASDCLTCPLAKPNLYNGGCYATCPPSSYQESVGVCADCDEACAECDGGDSTDCTACETPTPLLYEGSCYNECPIQSYPVDAGHCDACHETCLTCSGDGDDQCDSCSPDYPHAYEGGCFDDCPLGTFADSPSTCAACIDLCDVCSDAETCQICTTDAFLYKGECYETCPDGSYAADASTCAECDSTCATCAGPGSDDCLSCASSRPFLEGGQCLDKCPAGKFADTPTTCDDCDTPCAECAFAATNCTACGGATPLLYDGNCYDACPDGSYQASASACAPCHASCGTCSGAADTQCDTCAPTHPHEYNGRCYATCPSLTYPDSSTTCAACHGDCLTCSGSGASECTSCKAGSKPFLYLGSCFASCPSGSYVVNASTCGACESPCATCSSRANNCLTCELTHPILFNSSCYASCPVGTYPSGGGSSCTSCPSTCAACNSPSACTTCAPASPLLYQGACHSACPDGSYGANSTHCAQCSPPCLKCDAAGSSACTACPISAPFLYEGQCRTACPSGTYANGNVCVVCDAPCVACTGAGSTACLSCDASSELPLYYNRTCLDECPPGSYESSATACSACYSTCATCTNGTSDACLSCMPSTPRLVNGRCYTTCPTGTFPGSSPSSCDTCHGSCNGCDGPTDSDCTSCSGSARLYQSRCHAGGCPEGTRPSPAGDGSCVVDCPDGEYGTSDGACHACEGVCAVCEGPSRCVACPPGYVLSGTGCIESELSASTVASGTLASIVLLIIGVIGAPAAYFVLRWYSFKAYTGVLGAALALISLATDIVFTVTANARVAGGPLAISAIAFIVLPAAVNLATAVFFSRRLLQEDSNWMRSASTTRRHVLLTLFVVLSATQMEFLILLRSRMLGMPLLSARWADQTYSRLRHTPLIGLVLQNIPFVALASIFIAQDAALIPAVVALIMNLLLVVYHLYELALLVLTRQTSTEIVMPLSGDTGTLRKTSTLKRRKSITAADGEADLPTSAPPTAASASSTALEKAEVSIDEKVDPSA